MHDVRHNEKSHTFNVMKHIWRENGIVGFYGGLKPDLIRLIPSNAILFIVYEEAKKYL
jgi:solute carrier family 25 (mitochondrial folate transporter), member 32